MTVMFLVFPIKHQLPASNTQIWMIVFVTLKDVSIHSTYLFELVYAAGPTEKFGV